MPEPILLDQLHITFFRPDPLDDATSTAARNALESPQFLNAIRDEVRRILDANPALAVLDLVVSW